MKIKKPKVDYTKYNYKDNYSNIWYSDGFGIGQNGITTRGGYTVFKGNTLIENIETPAIGNIHTNNQAELQGIERAVELMSKNDLLITDSMNSMYWIHKGKARSRSDLNNIIIKITKLSKEKNISIQWKRREENLAGHYNETID
jgi:ribonuclease HI